MQSILEFLGWAGWVLPPMAITFGPIILLVAKNFYDIYQYEVESVGSIKRRWVIIDAMKNKKKSIRWFCISIVLLVSGFLFFTTKILASAGLEI